jgi:uncharacterized protein YqfA (UPF0365 family)
MSTAQAVVVCFVAVLVVVLVLGLVYLTGTEALQWLSGLFALSATGVSSAVAVQVRRTNRGVAAVQQQTNGGLDLRMRAAVESVLSETGLIDRRD